MGRAFIKVKEGKFTIVINDDVANHTIVGHKLVKLFLDFSFVVRVLGVVSLLQCQESKWLGFALNLEKVKAGWDKRLRPKYVQLTILVAFNLFIQKEEPNSDF